MYGEAGEEGKHRVEPETGGCLKHIHTYAYILTRERSSEVIKMSLMSKMMYLTGFTREFRYFLRRNK